MKSTKLIIAMLLLGLGSILFSGCSDSKTASTDQTTTTEKAHDMGNMEDGMPHAPMIADEFKDSKNPYRVDDNSGYDPEAVAKGQQLFKANCTACHGVKGDGKGPSAAGLNPPPRNFTSDHLSTMGENQLISTISNGSEGTAMVSFKDKFSIDERWLLVSYICTLNPTGMCATPGSAHNAMDGSSDSMMGSNDGMNDHSDSMMGNERGKLLPGDPNDQ